MNDSPRRDSESLDSKDADDIAAGNCNSPILHGQPHEFLGSVSQVGKVNVKDVADISSIDVDGVRGNFDLEMGLDTLQDMLDGKRNSELEVEQLSNCSTHENEPHFKLDFHNSVDPEANDACGGVSSPQTSQIDHTPSESPSSTESVDTNSEADECMNESTPSSPASNIAENGLSYYSLNGYGLNHCVGDSDMDDTIMEVVLHPDYVIYRDNYCMGLKLTFSQYCIQINDSTACEKEGTFNIEWEVDDLINIKSQSIQSSGIVLMTLHLVSSNAAQSNHVSCTSGIDELKIAIADYNWSLKHKQITSLNVKYLDMWSDLLDMDVEGDENNPPVPRCYFPNFQKPFDEVVYPKGDPDAVSLSKRDVDLLLPDTYINDTIIDFYIQFLKSKMQDEEKSRFHFFNSFFFRKLADMDKNPSSASDGKAAFLRVRKWTRKVNLFEKDYIFIPVNFNLHWSLIVICHPGEVVGFNDKEPDKSLRVPCILHMDSIKGLHSGLKNLIQSYLWEEWKERKKDACGEDLSSRFLNMRFVPVVLPQQENSYDCGLFLLHYLERFLADAPFDFNPFKLTKFSNFLNLDWFPPSEAYLKRTRIQRLIFELVDNNGSHGGFSSDYSDDHHHSENNDSRTGVNCHVLNGETSTSHSRHGIEITLLSASSSLDPKSLNTSGMVLKELFGPGAKAGSLPGQCQSIDQQSSDHRPNGSIFTMEENTDFSEQLMYTTTDPNIQQVTGISPQSCSLPYLPTARGKEISHGPQTSLQGGHNTESPLDTSCASDDSDDIGVIENCTIRHEASSSYEDERGENNCISIKDVEHLPDITVSAAINLPIDSLEDIPPHSNATFAGNENGDQHSSYLQHLPDISVSAAINLPIDSLEDISQHSNATCAGNKNEDQHSSCREHLPDTSVSAAINLPIDASEDISQHSNATCAGNKNEDQHSSCLEHLPDTSVSAASNLPIDSLEDISQHTNAMCAGNKNGDQHLSCLEHLPDISVPAAINLPIDSLEEISQHSNAMCAGNKNGDQHPSCLETPTIQLPEVSDAIDDSRTPTLNLHQVSDAVDDEVSRDDVQMMDDMEPDICEEPAVKKRRLTSLQDGSDGVQTESNL